jgi:APA family basic amino acid/polyamine antiporter
VTGTGQSLRRELGVGGATLLGLGSILGTGVFVSIGIAAGVAGSAVVVAVALAAIVATFNGLSSAQLAAAHPVSGGTYEYGHAYLTPALGFSAGWLFLLAKSASAATAALGFAGYAIALWDGDRSLLVPIAVAALVALTLVVLSGIRRSNTVNAVIVTIVLVGLGAFVVAGAGEVSGDDFAGLGDTSLASLFEATALMFVAYTGYGRIATLGEEVHRPQVTIPRAIVATLVVTMIVYVTVAVIAVAAGGADALAAATEGVAAPLEVVARSFAIDGVDVAVAVAALVAMLGVLLNLILGLSRVLLAMGRRGDMPGGVAKVVDGSPRVAVATVAVVIGVLVLIGDVRTTWAFSAFTVLVYYALTNLAALRLPAGDRRFPRWTAGAGLVACLGLAFWVPWPVWLSGIGLLAAGFAVRYAIRRSGR